MEENSNFLDNWTPIYFIGVGRFKSIRRALKRGHLSPTGAILGNRLFHNRKNTCTRGKDSRELNTLKKKAYFDYDRLKESGRI